MTEQTMILKNGQAQPLSVLGTEVRFLCDADATGNAWSLMEVTMQRDSGPPLHHHDWDEAYYIIEGEVHFTVGEKSVLATSGDFLYTPAGVPHGFHGTSGRARMLILDVPAHAGKFFREVNGEVTELPRQFEKVIEIGDRNGIHFARAS
jgi:mannose-6-phosphate isomerase-like protein (cupin superfamily)